MIGRLSPERPSYSSSQAFICLSAAVLLVLTTVDNVNYFKDVYPVRYFPFPEEYSSTHENVEFVKNEDWYDEESLDEMMSWIYN